ncbi:hypothetical protein F7731_13115 [Cytobacillus depressus]|uniref:Uncharacterized protein n=1 Tax=Cytobacillus depressus TaxID=1602942 RepID=A0A6L3V3Y9_9BACI|nr:hypothetical protein [Cytobacillus depressus]KAB2334710.1 hypothetical protein F7731_13115 [Cytobacillus depressus]
MKKRFLITVCFALACFGWIMPFHIQANGMDENNKNELLKALEEQLRDTVHYYHQDSVKIMDGSNFQGTVLKVTKKDDPKTEENEEVIEEYQANLAIAFVEFKLIRDRLFFFEKTEFYYYDLDNKEFLASSQVFGNDEVQTFFDHYKNDVHKKLTLSSEILLLFLISFIITVPLFIMIFHNKGRSTIIHYNLLE